MMGGRGGGSWKGIVGMHRCFTISREDTIVLSGGSRAVSGNGASRVSAVEGDTFEVSPTLPVVGRDLEPGRG